jgi:hypothetical protein
MLLTIAASLGASLTEVAAMASLYYLLYGLMQPVWGMASDRLGRVRVMRLTLFGAAVAGLLSASAPNLAVLVATRALAGGFFAAVIPASLVYIGDTVGMGSRQKALADLMAASAVGTAMATDFRWTENPSQPLLRGRFSFARRTRVKRAIVRAIFRLLFKSTTFCDELDQLGVTGGEQYVDALVDTGSTYCIVPRRMARLLGFNKDNRLGTRRVSVVGG